MKKPLPRTFRIQHPSFPAFQGERPITLPKLRRWKPICGDADHWRVGIYSPDKTARRDIIEFEQHDCPELFMLIAGRITLVVIEHGVERKIPLTRNVPVVISAPHAGYSPGKQFGGKAFVVERDEFNTVYRLKEDWIARQCRGEK